MGRIQNAQRLGGTLKRLRWHNRPWDPVACAKEVKEALDKLKKRKDPPDPSSSMERKKAKIHALGMQTFD